MFFKGYDCIKFNWLTAIIFFLDYLNYFFTRLFFKVFYFDSTPPTGFTSSWSSCYRIEIILVWCSTALFFRMFPFMMIMSYIIKFFVVMTFMTRTIFSLLLLRSILRLLYLSLGLRLFFRHSILKLYSTHNKFIKLK